MSPAQPGGAPLAAGAVLGGDRSEARLGAGNLGTVYRVTQLETGAARAMKVLPLGEDHGARGPLPA